MPKFKIGDQVELLGPAIDNGYLKAGSKGTILEEDRLPYVQWDDFTGGHDNGDPSVHGSSWAVNESNIKRIKKPTTPKTKETKNMTTKKPGTSHGKPTTKGMKVALKPKAKTVPKPKYPAPRVQRELIAEAKPLEKCTKAELIVTAEDRATQFHNLSADYCIEGTKLDRALVDLKEAKAKIKELSKALEAAK